MIGTNEIIIIGVVILVLFGASAIPRFARSLGQAKREFDKGAREGATDTADGEKAATAKADTSDAARTGDDGRK